MSSDRGHLAALSIDEGFETSGRDRRSTVALSWGSFYDPEQDAIFCGHDSGFFSMCSVSLWNLADLQRFRHRFPARIDYSLNFQAFRNPEQIRQKTDLYPLFFKPHPASSINPRRRLQYVAHHGIYSMLDYERLNPIIDAFFRPSDRVLGVQADLIRRYKIDPAKTIAVVYRGTDKSTEIKVASPEAFLAVTQQMLNAHPGHRVWIQTDEWKVREMFVHAFAGRCFYVHEMPVSLNGGVVHGQDDETLNMDRSEFGVLLVAVNSLLAQADVVVNHTGNMALWLCLFRGHAHGVWQFDDEAKLVDPAFPACYFAAVRRFTIKATSETFLRRLLVKATSWDVLRRHLYKFMRTIWRC